MKNDQKYLKYLKSLTKFHNYAENGQSTSPVLFEMCLVDENVSIFFYSFQLHIILKETIKRNEYKLLKTIFCSTFLQVIYIFTLCINPYSFLNTP